MFYKLWSTFKVPSSLYFVYIQPNKLILSDGQIQPYVLVLLLMRQHSRYIGRYNINIYCNKTKNAYSFWLCMASSLSWAGIGRRSWESRKENLISYYGAHKKNIKGHVSCMGISGASMSTPYVFYVKFSRVCENIIYYILWVCIVYIYAYM